MIIKVSSLHSALHDSDSFSSGNREFLQEIASKIKNDIIQSSVDDYDADLKLIFIESGGSENLFLKNFHLLKEPYYFITTGKNNSLAATLEIATYLNKLNKKFEILHGDIDYIVSRILKVAKPKEKILEGKRYGVIGQPSDWLISSIPQYDKIENLYGCKLIDVPLKELEDIYLFNQKLPANPQYFGFSKDEVDKAEKVYDSLKVLLNKYKLHGFALRCFDLLTSIKTTGCLALAKLNQEGYISTCEGDIMALISMAIAKKISNQSSFQANPSSIDVTNNTIIFAHCTIPLDMVTSFKYDTHFESGIGVAIKGKLEAKEVTILRISSNLKDVFISKGTIIENLDKPDLCRTQIKVKLVEPVSTLLKNPCGNHHIIFYGDYTDKLNQLLK